MSAVAVTGVAGFQKPPIHQHNERGQADPRVRILEQLGGILNATRAMFAGQRGDISLDEGDRQRVLAPECSGSLHGRDRDRQRLADRCRNRIPDFEGRELSDALRVGHMDRIHSSPGRVHHVQVLCA